jgi:hypothetical protein
MGTDRVVEAVAMAGPTGIGTGSTSRAAANKAMDQALCRR